MLSLEDPIWLELTGGYGVPYDPRPAERRIMSGVDADGAWSELWQELHHQGDIGQASYAAVIALAQWERRGDPDWNLYALASCIEVERHRRTNPPVLPELDSEYFASLDIFGEAALNDLRSTRDPMVVRAALGMVALCRGQIRLGALLSGIDESEVAEYLEETMAWSELYGSEGRSEAG